MYIMHTIWEILDVQYHCKATTEVGKPQLLLRVHTNDSGEAVVRAGSGTNVDVDKAIGCSVLIVTAGSLDSDTVISSIVN